VEQGKGGVKPEAGGVELALISFGRAREFKMTLFFVPCSSVASDIKDFPILGR
jgi:hypothetical protein